MWGVGVVVNITVFGTVVMGSIPLRPELLKKQQAIDIKQEKYIKKPIYFFIKKPWIQKKQVTTILIYLNKTTK